jgi:hypothetical protein
VSTRAIVDNAASSSRERRGHAQVELLVPSPDDTLIELALDDSQVRPVLARRLRDRDAMP